MTNFNEADHPRAASGLFTDKSQSAPEVRIDSRTGNELVTTQFLIGFIQQVFPDARGATLHMDEGDQYIEIRDENGKIIGARDAWDTDEEYDDWQVINDQVEYLDLEFAADPSVVARSATEFFITVPSEALESHED
jgi:hypothetical protein